MKKITALIIAIMVCIFCTACSKNEEENTKYNLIIISPEYIKVSEKIESNLSDDELLYCDNPYELIETIDDDVLKTLKSITIFSQNYSQEFTENVINKCKKNNIPVFFMFGNVDNSVLDSYDKAFCISTDFTYIGEDYAEKIHSMWKDTIYDRDKNKILSLSFVYTDEISQNVSDFSESLFYNLELLGIPTDKHTDITGDAETVLAYCKENSSKNEVYIILSQELLPLFHDNYPPVSDGVELLGLLEDFDNNYIDDNTFSLCFLDYQDFFNAKNSIMTNIENRKYPFENFEYLLIDKTAYIQPHL